MERVSSMNVEEGYLSWETPGPGVSHEADDPLNSAHRRPNKETRTKTEYGRQSGRVVTAATRLLSPLLYFLFTHDCVATRVSYSIMKFADDDETTYRGR